MPNALHEMLNFLRIAPRPFLFQANELPASLAIDFFGDVDIRQLGFVRQVGNHP